jgi:diguanylate cyclase (GGDEF)-like protein/PAS domain S-box-containing protein
LILTGRYDGWLVGLSVAFALLSSYAALDLTGRIAAARHWSRVLWLGAGATAMGLGIWAMHYIAMLAFTLPVPVLYHYPTVLLSLLAAILASLVALFTVSRERMGFGQELVGAVAMGSGIGAMHYVGMAAMRLPATMDYRMGRVALSLLVAVVISFVALDLAFRTRADQKTTTRKVLSALVMGSAIPLLHYTGMWAVTFRSAASMPSLDHAIGISTVGLVAISLVTLIGLAGVISTSFLDRLLAAQRAMVEGAQKGERYFRSLAEAVPGIIWTTRPDGYADFFNDRWYAYSGLDHDQSKGSGWSTILHPDDVETTLSTWQRSLRTGEHYEVEYRFRQASDGAYRWFLGRASPIRDEHGEIINWFGTCTDIEDQKHNQQVLEQQIKERTVELADTNTRLQEEMWEKDSAQRALDLQNEKMVFELTERSRRATLLAKMGELLQSCVSKEEVFAAALGFAPKIFPNRRGAIALLNAAGNLAEITGSWQDCQLPVSVFEPSSCWALRTGQPHPVPAGDTTAPCAHADGVRNSYICIPILAQGQALGILHFQASDEAPEINDSDSSLKATFAGQVGLSVANIRLRDALRTQSIKDPLTGLYNRRYLEEMLEREIRRAVRSEQSLGILMLDLDHFKKFNDTYGHEAGDTVLREAAAFFLKSIRAEDIVCRFGGEEFVVILPTADLNSSHNRGEKIRSKLRELNVRHQGQSLGAITVSVGVAALPIHGMSAKELLEAADAALYRAKREGRDRVVDAEVRTSGAITQPAAELAKA